MPINFDALRTGAGMAQVPADGHHQATLDRAKVYEGDKGTSLITEWMTADGSAAWTSWNRFDQTGMEYTRDLLLGLGVNFDAINSEQELEDFLANHSVGHMFDVKTQSRQGSQGDKWFTNTYVDGKTLGVQEQIDVPADTTGLPEASSAGNGAAKTPDDERIPF